jgi:hypothetical protein
MMMHVHVATAAATAKRKTTLAAARRHRLVVSEEFLNVYIRVLL